VRAHAGWGDRFRRRRIRPTPLARLAIETQAGRNVVELEVEGRTAALVLALDAECLSAEIIPEVFTVIASLVER
jgi:hypothetical protein